MAKSSKPRKRKPQKKNEQKRRMKEFSRMTPSQQFLSLHNDLNDIVINMTQLVDYVSKHHDKFDEAHHELIKRAQEELANARSISVSTLDRHNEIQQRKASDESYTAMDENMEYCLLTPELTEVTMGLIELYSAISPVVHRVEEIEQ